MSEQFRFPTVKVHGNAYERGLQYGQQATDRIKLSIKNYQETFLSFAGMGLEQYRSLALTFEEPIRQIDERYLQEISGIAEGAGVLYEDILAINVRTEIMFSGVAKKQAEELNLALECSSFSVLPEKSKNQSTLIGQNWDWTAYAQETVIILEAVQSDGPNFVTVVEAGLLAKTGMNSYGVGVSTNALISFDDKGNPGMPYHIALRKVLDSKNISTAVGVLQSTNRSSSANYMIAQEGGLAINLECQPGLVTGSDLIQPIDGYIVHTNHFLDKDRRKKDVAPGMIPDTLFRLQAISRDFKRDELLDVVALKEIFSDHRNFPTSVCRHENPEVPKIEDSETIASVIMDLDNKTMWLADGHPCTREYVEMDFSELLKAE